MSRTLPLVGLLIALPLSLAAQVPAGTVRGRAIDAATSTPIADARVTLQLDNAAAGTPSLATQTDADGRFQFTGLAVGRYALSVTTVGYIFVRRTVTVDATSGADLVIPLAEGAGAYRETVDVSAGVAPPGLEAATRDTLGSAALQELRGVITDDPLRAVQALPGVVTGDDFRSEFSVRGSAFRHVGIVLDETATPLLTHTVRGEEDTGSLAMINTDILARATLSSGPHPRRHGDWLGATLEFDVREGSRDRPGLRAAVSGTAASFVAEGPIGRARRGSWLVSMRRSYLDWLIRKIEPEFESTLGFYDGQVKLAWDLTPRQQAQLLVVGGRTNYRESDAGPTNGLEHAQSGTTLVSALWRRAGDRSIVRQRVSFVAARFRNRGVRGQELARGFAQAVIARSDASFAARGGWTIDAGALVEFQRGNEIAREFRSAPGGGIRVFAERDVSADTTLGGGFVSAARRVGSADVTAGLRVTARTGADDRAMSPWLLGRWQTGRFVWHAAAGGAGQFPDALTVALPGRSLELETSRGFDAGFEYRMTDALSWRGAMFHRRDGQLLRLAQEDRLNPITGQRLVASVFPTYRSSLDGTTNGFDVVLTRRAASGPTGWISYTWARTEMRDDETAEVFDGDFDQRHTVNLVVSQRLSYRLQVGAKLRVGSNVPIVGYFAGTPEDLRLSASRNDVRLPVYARLDLRVTRTFTFERRRLTLFGELLNVLNRDNFGTTDGPFAGRLRPRVSSRS